MNEIKDSREFEVSRRLLWTMIRNPEVLARIVPECDGLEIVGENEYQGKMRIKVGPMDGVFQGTVILSNLQPSESLHLVANGRGGSGIITGEGDVRLLETQNGTELSYSGYIEASGRIASVGQRLLTSSAKAIFKQILENLDRQIQSNPKPGIELKDSREFEASRDMLWEMIQDPKVLRRILPGCEYLESVDKNVFQGRMRIRVGPVEDVFQGRVTFSKLQRPESLHLVMESSAPAGLVRGEGDIVLQVGLDGTEISYSGNGEVMGRLGLVRPELLKSSARAIFRQTLLNLEKEVANTEAPATLIVETKLERRRVFAASRELLWAMIRDPNLLAKIVPGCEELDLIEENEFQGQMNIQIGRMNGAFLGSVILTDLQPPESLRLVVVGRGDVGIIQGEGAVVLKNVSNGTELSYSGIIDVSGRVAALGQRPIRNTASNFFKEILANLEYEIGEADNDLKPVVEEVEVVQEVEVAEQESPLVFLCHASEDKVVVRNLYSRLKEAGIRVWLDEVDLLPGQDWKLEITKAIRSSHYFLACISSGSVDKRGFVQKEIVMALDVLDEMPEGEIYLIPARLDDCAIPDRLASRQWVNLYEQDGFDRLLMALKSTS